MVSLQLSLCKESAKQPVETTNDFQGLPDAENINLSPEQNLPIGNYAKVTEEVFRKVYPEDWAIQVPTNYYRNEQFVVSVIFYDWGANVVRWSSGVNEYNLASMQAIFMGVTTLDDLPKSQNENSEQGDAH